MNPPRERRVFLWLSDSGQLTGLALFERLTRLFELSLSFFLGRFGLSGGFNGRI
jgi:hypothetical protein